MNAWLVENLACPRHHLGLSLDASVLTCPKGCTYPVVDGVPVMLLDDRRQTMDLASESLRQSTRPGADGELYIDSLGLNDQEKEAIVQLAASTTARVDPVVSFLVGATNGIAYKHLIGRLNEYPIPTCGCRPPTVRYSWIWDASGAAGASRLPARVTG
jgi:uncharacterized protein YbaR (Trm112 family)